MERKPAYEELERRVRDLEQRILESERTEKALRESEERYRLLFNDSRDAIYITTREGVFIDANQALLDLFGYTREEILAGLTVQKIYVNPTDRIAFQEKIEQRGAVRDFEATFRRKDGEELACLVTSSVRRSSRGGILGYQGIIRDVTRQKQAEKALREREAHYRAMVDAFDGQIYICSQDYRVEFMNQRLIERTGYDATGTLCYRALHDLDAVCPWCVNERVFKGETVHWEVQSPKDERWYYIVNTPIYHTDGSISKQAMILDITDRKQMEEALRESSENIKYFAYSVSHDLKSPAIGIHGLARLLQQHHGDRLDEKGRNYCDRILKAAEQIVMLAEQVNVYIAAKETPLNIGPVNLDEILQMVGEEFATRFHVRQIRWSRQEEMPEIRADRICILRVLRNLVDNALKYGGEELSEIRIRHTEMDQYHVLSVEDDGVGVKEEDSQKLFGLFMRKGTSRGVEGAGLGLAIVKEIANRHGGHVWLEPGPRKGSAFSISISKDL
ncbi:MAG: PAS domain S-box protein [Deltaproteobacteria bacterium]|nr:PAS domain S-box protein [Deltaproteobacteria bacterium]